MPSHIDCPACAAHLSMPDGMSGKSVRCPKCHITFRCPSVSEATLPPPPPPRAAPPPLAKWHYSRDGRQSGSVTTEELQELVESGKLRPSDLLWKEGMDGWVPANSVRGLLVWPVPSPPPLPPPLPPPPTARLAPEQPAPRRRGNSLEVINDVIPREHRRMLHGEESAYLFEWMDTNKGGCSFLGTEESAEQFILVSDQRVLYETNVSEGEGAKAKYVRTSGSIPITKIGFVGTTSAQSPQQGCNPPHQVHLLRVESGGGSILIPFLSEKKAKRVRRVIEELILRQ